ncbi:4-amino-4-deoxy-L-arabinose transferase-like glycosyltransferase [Antricoccus suffuscus]|uniref:4-amino-4-deoxy-L-arabinose transferase-like glycosyltransferase n=1 Tax=Antricoccus suffuscus TaxID=1629062 RepID=A0A2T0ZYQ1_9ACTN|nr:glycosyltransferase family 39 protein [Antricoccus suffuscus]PRZ41482.1 4-amino-4-deoxy-L-arabinose transferase-like glycosyltransferase [Antricoccus suffuscus]
MDTRRGEALDRRPRWERPALGALLLGTLVLYVYNLSQSVWANPFYAAAVQAGSHSWKAAFYGGFDFAGGITVDKPPAALWIGDASVRLFGLSSWSLLVPQALLGVATVAVLYAAVRRWYGAPAAFAAGIVLAVTPIAALMFRFNNPDALLTFLMTCGAYATMRAIDSEAVPNRRWPRTALAWMCIVGIILGFAFLTKLLQALLVIPAFAVAYLVAGSTALSRRVLHLLAAAGAMIVAAGWWILTVSLVPAGDRPFVGGSQTNSILELTFGYNGFGRLTGDETGSVHLSTHRSWGDFGLLRMWGPKLGGQIGWFLIAALVALVAGLWATRHAPRTDIARAGYLVWGGWLLVTGVVFSYMQGIFHEYYTIALAPAIAALVGIGAAAAYRHRERRAVRLTVALTIAATAGTSFVFLQRSAYFLPPLRWVVLVGLLVVAVGIFVVPTAGRRPGRVLVALAAVLALAGPVAFVGNTVSSGYMGSIVAAGPMPTKSGPMHTLRTKDRAVKGQLPKHAGGLLFASKPAPELVAYLKQGGEARWLVATVGAQRAAGYQLALDRPVMAIGGFNGSDPYPTVAQFKEYVAHGDIRWFADGPPLGGSAGGGQVGGSRASAIITKWVRDTFTLQFVGGIEIYDLTKPR